MPTYPYSFSRMLHVTRFTVALRVQPDARPFSILAVGEAGSASIDIDPVSRTWHAVSTVPTATARAGDFSALLRREPPREVIWDFYACPPDLRLQCAVIPNDDYPERSRMDLNQFSALGFVLLPTQPAVT